MQLHTVKFNVDGVYMVCVEGFFETNNSLPGFLIIGNNSTQKVFDSCIFLRSYLHNV